MGRAGWIKRVASRPGHAAGGRLLVLLALASCLTACGSTAPGATTGGPSAGSTSASSDSGGGSTSTSGSFVGTASNAAILVQWTRTGGQLTGELQQALLEGSGAQEQVSSSSQAFTGTLSGNSVTLSLNQGLGSVSNLTGTLNGQQLDLNYPGQGGGIITIPMSPGGPSDFNSDLANLQSQAGQAQTTAAQQQAAQQQANTVGYAAQAVSNDLSTLQSAQHNATGTGSVAGDLAQMRKDLAQTQADLQHVLGEAGHTDVNTLCSDADTVSSDYDTVSGDYDTISGDQGSSGGDTGSIQAAVKALQRDGQALDAYRASDPADVPADAPTDAQIAQAVKAAQAQAGGESATTGSAMSQATTMASTAKAASDKALAACSAAGGG
jgi:hypothetical protein